MRRLIMMPDSQVLVLSDEHSVLGRVSGDPQGVRILFSFQVNEPSAFCRWPIERVEVRRWEAVPVAIQRIVDDLRTGAGNAPAAK